MRYLLDADCCIYAMDGSSEPLRARLAGQASNSVGISAITLSEILLGAARGKAPPAEQVELFLSVIPLVAFDGPAARAYARLPFKRARFDRLLAAHALSLDVGIITNNTADFADIPDLRVENWTLPL